MLYERSYSCIFKTLVLRNKLMKCVLCKHRTTYNGTGAHKQPYPLDLANPEVEVMTLLKQIIERSNN